MTTTALLDRPTTVPVTDDATRREFIVGGLAVGLLAACGQGSNDGDTSNEPDSPATRTVTHFAGTTEVPVDPKRIVTLQDQNALLSLLELGIKPVASAGQIDDDGTQSFRRTEGFDTSGIEFVGEYGETNLEAVAAARPDLIVCDESSADGLYEKLSEIAPTVFVQVLDRRLNDALADFAEVVGAEDEAERLRTDYEDRIAGLLSSLGADKDRTSVSLLSTGDPGSFFQADSGGQAQFTVMADLGPLRPPPQRPGASEDFAEYSLEQLPDHDADAVIISDFSGEGADPGVAALVESDLYDNLAATRAGQAYVIDATLSVGAAWVRMGVFLDELERIVLDPDFDHEVVSETP